MAGASSSMFGLMATIVVVALLMTSTSQATTYDHDDDHYFPANAPQGVPCSMVIPAIAPCKGFLLGTESKPSQACCAGAKDIDEKSPSRQDRVDACNCIKKALQLVGKYDPNRISMIPKQCNLPFTLPAVGPDADCTKVVPGF